MALEIVTSEAMREPVDEGVLEVERPGVLSRKARVVPGSEYRVAKSTAERVAPFVKQFGKLASWRPASYRISALDTEPRAQVPRVPKQMVSMKPSAAHDAMSNYVYEVLAEAARSGIVHPEQQERIIFSLALAFALVLGKPEALGQAVPVLFWLHHENQKEAAQDWSQQELADALMKEFPSLPSEAADLFALSYKIDSTFVLTPKDIAKLKKTARKYSAKVALEKVLADISDSNENVGRIYNGPRMTEQDLLWRLNQYSPDELQPLLSLVVEAQQGDTIRREAHPFIDVFMTAKASQPALGPGLLDQEDDDDSEDEDYAPSEDSEDDGDEDYPSDDEEEGDSEEEEEEEEGEDSEAEAEPEQAEPDQAEPAVVTVAEVVPATDQTDARVVVAAADADIVAQAAVDAGLGSSAAEAIANTATTVGITEAAVDSLNLEVDASQAAPAAPAAPAKTPTPVPVPVPVLAAKTPTPQPKAAKTPTPVPAPPAKTPTPVPAAVSKTPTPVVAAKTPTPVPAVASKTPTPQVSVVAKTPTPVPVAKTPTPQPKPSKTPTPQAQPSSPLPRTIRVSFALPEEEPLAAVPEFVSEPEPVIPEAPVSTDLADLHPTPPVELVQ